MNNQLTYIIIGAGIQLILFVGYQILRKPKVYSTILILTIGIALIGLFNMDRPVLELANGNAATWTFFPVLFMIYFGLLRQLFLKLFKNGPLMTGYMQWSWE